MDVFEVCVLISRRNTLLKKLENIRNDEESVSFLVEKWLPGSTSINCHNPARPGLKFRKSQGKFSRFNHKSQIITITKMFLSWIYKCFERFCDLFTCETIRFWRHYMSLMFYVKMYKKICEKPPLQKKPFFRNQYEYLGNNLLPVTNILKPISILCNSFKFVTFNTFEK